MELVVVSLACMTVKPGYYKSQVVLQMNPLSSMAIQNITFLLHL